jgi:steroid delta-isomerase-like uncharacterized protein
MTAGPVADTFEAEVLCDLARRWLALWETDDLGAFDALHAPDFVDRSSAGRPSDRAGFREGIRELRRAFPDFRATEVGFYMDEARQAVSVRWSARGTQRGEYLGVAASGRRVVFSGIEIIRVAGGRIVERWGEWDGLGLRAQLEARVIPSTPAAPD